jgi:hypothetical protein
MTTKEDIKKDLKVLGRSSKQIAAKLQELGIKGKQINSRSCPIANYLSSCGYEDVIVEEEDIESYTTTDLLYIYLNIRKTAISTFIRNFDNGKYPELKA